MDKYKCVYEKMDAVIRENRQCHILESRGGMDKINFNWY